MASFPAVPLPPTDLSAHHGASVAFTVICTILFAVAVGYALRYALRGDVLGLVCLIGGLLAGVLEPMLDSQGLLWFAHNNTAVTVTSFHRFIPLYVVLGYSFFFGAQAFIAFRAYQQQRSVRWYWGLYACSWLLDFALQSGGAQLHLYKYYGHQPFLIFGAPAWWFSIDASFAALAAVVMTALAQRLRGAGMLLVILIIPGVYAGLNGAAGWPIFGALNSSVSTAAVWGAGALTIALGLTVQAFCAPFLAARPAVPVATEDRSRAHVVV